MAQNEVLVLRCQNKECSRPIKIKRPAKSGIYPIACPHCSAKMRVRIPGMDAAPAPDVPDNSKAEPIAFSDTFIVNERYEVECPHCHAHKISFQSKVPGDKAFACPRCKGPLKAFVKQKTKPHASDSAQFIRGKLVLLRKYLLNKDFPLREGRNIIGREDASAPSDISIKGDKTMSRRSVQMDMNTTENGYTFKLTVIKAVNPVIHNGSVLMNGESVSLNFGDTIVMGTTKFRFDRQN